ncbi:sporulation protein YpjB [Cytobacillus firmus]|jgi:sporulation protein YpjB|uniref:Sporulation protein YpjB n=1 Tax=Cytobacillus firmus TaxID=1399 RepID=A0AA46P5A7_CYTFI|nr:MULTISPECIES: sporulation protein YpjB [Bacillales]KML45674.1 sporulation protein [Cytobacillus firmus]MBG9445061.1 sporulation protein [Cytobacillus firmus]MBY6051430.1 sporulation protein YpjB [Cytobacillus firmus]MCC3647892.1 sporulation protein YpjB [Cytobacillus oceanisediminis]MCS0654010.1 sporulation protein YpjB [Cytobacillus firmus]
MRRKVIAFLFIIMLLPGMVSADKTTKIDKLDQLSNEALQMVKLHRYEDAKKLLEYFSEQFVAVNGKDRPFTMDELRIITVSHDDAVQAAVNTSMSHEERLNHATKFRLVMDAISSKYQPLWTEMEKPIMSVFGEVKEAAYSGNNENFHSRLNSFLSLYEVIYPSLKIDVDAEKVQKLNARINFIDHYRPQVLSQQASQQELAALENDLQTIFDEMTEDETDPSLWWVIISTGSIIIITLSYVGWRKYKGDRARQKNRS